MKNLEKKGAKQGTGNALVINAGGDSGATINVLGQMVDAATLGTTIKRVSTTANGKVVIRTGTIEDAQKLGAELDKLQQAGLTWSTSAPRFPRIVATGIPRSWDETAVTSHITSRAWPETVSGSPVRRAFRPLFRRGPKEGYLTQWVIEVDPATRKRLLEGSITVGLLKITAHDFIEQPRCFKCQAFGHIGKKCRASVETCAWCAGNGHSTRECPQKTRPAVCINCRSAGLRGGNNHPAFSKRCPAYLRFLEKKVRITNYE